MKEMVYNLSAFFAVTSFFACAIFDLKVYEFKDVVVIFCTFFFIVILCPFKDDFFLVILEYVCLEMTKIKIVNSQKKN